MVRGLHHWCVASSTTTAATSVTYGAGLTFETLVALDDAPLRQRPEDDTLIRVIAGVVLLTVDAGERVLVTGDEAIVPAGAPHRLASAGGDARLVTGFRPARR
jgi:mannose-6-phosphate isomerase-like protein (cupin superfamily)